jgi:hypothetical protein
LIHSIVDTIDFICLFSDFQAIKTLKFLSFGIRAIRYPEFLFIFPAIRKKKKKNQPNLFMCERGLLLLGLWCGSFKLKSIGLFLVVVAGG